MSFYPGTSYTTLGGKIKQTIQGPSTLTLLLIGTAQDGPLNTPIIVRSAAEAERVFGPANYQNGHKDPTTGTESGKAAGATLPLAIAQAIAAGCQDIRAVRATGSFASGVLGASSVLSFKSVNPGRLYNDVSLSLTQNGSSVVFTLNQPLKKGGSLTYNVDGNATTLGEFIDRVNGSTDNRSVYIDKEFSGSQSLLSTLLASVNGASGSLTLSGGTNGCLARGDDYGPENFTTSGSGLFGYANALVLEDTGTFDSLLNKQARFDIACLTGIHVDDQVKSTGGTTSITSTSILADFAEFIDISSSETNPCIGVIGTRSHNLREETDVINYIKTNLLATDFGYYDQSKKWLKTGPFLYAGQYKSSLANGATYNTLSRIAVVAGPNAVFNHPDVGGDYTSNFHVAWAALQTTIPPEQAAVFSRIPGAKSFAPAYPSRYANLLLDGVGADPTKDLSGGGAYVIMTRDPRNSDNPLVVYDDPTAASRDDFFRNIQLVRLVNSVHKDTNYALAPFIGKPTGSATLAAMETKLQNVLDGYVASSGLIGGKGIGYNFKIHMDGTDQSVGRIRVDIELFPATALRKIAITVAVRQTS